jgi:hypothetical protein
MCELAAIREIYLSAPEEAVFLERARILADHPRVAGLQPAPRDLVAGRCRH